MIAETDYRGKVISGNIVEPVKTNAGLIDDVFLLKKRLEEISDEEKDIKEKVKWIEKELLDRMDAEGIAQIKDDMGRIVFFLNPALHARINKANEEEAHKILREWKEGDHIKEVITPATVSRIVKERINAGLHVDDEIFQYHIEQKLGMRK